MDTGTVTVISLAITTLGAVALAYIAWLTLKTNQHVKAVDSKVDVVDTKVQEVHNATNGMKTELVAAVGSSEYQRGIADQVAKALAESALLAKGKLEGQG